MAVASVLGMMGAFSGIMGGVCGSGGKLKTVGHGKKVQTCVWLSVKVLLCWTASLPCLGRPCLPFSPLPKQAEVPLLSPHPEGCGGCAWAWLGVGWQMWGSVPSHRLITALEELCVKLAVPRDAHFPPPVSPQVRCCCSQFSISRMRTKSNVLSAR